MYNVFHVLLLKQDTIKKGQVNKINELIEPKQKLDIGNNKKYEIEVSCNSKIYAKKVAKQLLRLYYLVS